MRITGDPKGVAEVKTANAAMAESGATARAAGAASASSAAKIAKTATSLKTVGRGLSTYVSLPLAGIGVAAGMMALDFDRSMRNVNSIAQLPQKRFERLKQGVLDLAGPTAQSPKTLAEGMYDLVSSGFDAAESLKIIRASALAASAGMTTAEVSTKAVAAVLNAYELPARRAGQVSDQLFETVNRGVLTFEELASTVGDVLPFATELHVGLSQIGAAISTMTKAGLPAPETVTRIKNVLVTLIKPGEDLNSLFREMGTSGEELVRKRGLQGALEEIVSHTDGSKEAIAELFPNIRAMGGVLALTGGHARQAAEDVMAFKDTTGATARALSQQEQSFGFQLQRAWAELSAVLIELGEDLLPIVVPFVLELAQAGRDVVGWFAQLPPPLQKVGLALAGMAFLAGPMLILTGSVLQLGLALSSIGMAGAATGGIGLALGAEVAIFLVLYNKVKWFRDAVDELWRDVGNQALFLISPISVVIRHFGFLRATTSRIVGAVVGFFRALPRKVAAGLSALPRLTGVLIGRLIGLWLTLPFRIPALVRQMSSRVLSLVGALAPKLASLGLRATTALAKGILRGAPAIWRFFTAIPGKIESLVNAAASRLVAVGRSIASKIASGLKEGLMDTLPGPVKDALGAAGGAAGAFGGFLGFAGGTLSAPGGLALVGEAGPELVNLPPRSQVIPAPRTRELTAPFRASPQPAALAMRQRGGDGRSRLLAPITVKVGRREVANVVVEATEDDRARL
jgi:TP901 family phage tail tape measure protein